MGEEGSGRGSAMRGCPPGAVAAAIVASAGAQAVPSRAFQVFGAGGPSIEPGFHGLDAVTADVPFEEALVDLARRVLALPPEDEPAGEGELVTR